MRSILAAAILIGAASAAFATPQSTASHTDQDSANRGLYVALRVCAACHAVGSLGHGPDGAAPTFAALGERFGAKALRRRLWEISASGHELMPAIPLTAREIEDVATYIASVAPPRRPPNLPRA